MTAVAAAVLAGSGAACAVADGLPRSRGVLYVIGDSWSAGLHADPAHTLAQDAADELGMTSVVDAESGTGYVHAPPGTSSYAARASEITTVQPASVVVVQGGSNDDGSDRSTLRAAIDHTVASVRQAFPNALVVLLGPGPDPWPITTRQTAVDEVLQQEAAALHVHYISPMQERWFTSATVDTIIDPATDHPTIAGDVVLGRRLAEEVGLLLNDRARPAARIRIDPPDTGDSAQT